MVDNNSQHIARFIDAFEEQIRKISAVEHQLYRKLLFVSLLDTLSRVVFPRASNRERFISFISKFSSWSEKFRVSLPHLSQLLIYAPEPDFEKLRLHVQRLFQQWGNGEIIHLGRDPNFEDINQLWPQRKSIEGVGLEFLQHINLLYTYRNSLVHEFRALGYGIEFPDDREPFYMIVKALPEETETWELCYPTDFLKSLAETCLSSLKSYLDKNSVNPYTSFTFGSYWISELNK